MKKILFLTLAIFCLCSCSWFDSDPIEPQIIGYGNLAYDEANNLYYAMIDSIRHNVAHVIAEDHNPRSFGTTQKLEPVPGMRVTLFTSKQNKEVQCLMGQKNAAEIEEMYKTNCTVAVVFLLIVVAFCISLFFYNGTEKVKIARAD